MSDHAPASGRAEPCTAAARRVLAAAWDRNVSDDLLFLERWEMAPVHGTAAALRAAQIRRANPALAEAVRSELARALSG
jgi:hypothetical protein